MSNNSHAFRILIHILPSAAQVNYVAIMKLTLLFTFRALIIVRWFLHFCF